MLSLAKLTSLVALALALSASEAQGQMVKQVVPDAQAASPRIAQPATILQPKCGTDASSSCVSLNGVKAIVSFGDSYTDCGNQRGGTCPNPVLPNGSTVPPATGATADYQYGRRASNGRTWVEDLAQNIGAQLYNFASSGATVDRNIIPASRFDNDMASEYQKFQQAAIKTNPQTTMCTFFFGINDRGKAASQDLLPKAVQKELSYVDQLKGTCSQFVFLDIRGGVFSTALQSGVANLAKQGVKATYFTYQSLFNDFVTNASKYGFKKTDPCLENTSDGAHWKLVCTPDEATNSLYYIGHHPTGKAHADMAAFLQSALTTCSTGKCGASA
ncbi:uncharacterized protein PFL1_03087 [Pseudozyma flocculosa PF-1]|uniref:SGNH hydrolase-type esterase domain-containing protein n=2 Tax=Pseudozyma flocculosa TaxID=84751 RepID=A0A5C3F081_9BASI|nr:uncharacterized protein PFL1_03087 [Pseudozyma flocculosa PF-1]EPQ29332.1 hypothetical protein PFL1_03087 [Pseudozyma flocculosa PF-1]SPO37848.1 uncharacterized protein PSFLO_03325 [Pseudozyma flocculosa]